MFSSDLLAVYDAVGRFPCSSSNPARTVTVTLKIQRLRGQYESRKSSKYLQATLRLWASTEVRVTIAVGTCVSRDKDTTAVPQSQYRCTV